MESQHAPYRPLLASAFVVSLICVVSASPTLAAGKKAGGFCASDRDLAALNARVLQTELMVAALSCDQKQSYNSFVLAYRDVLKERGQALQALFRRTHGSKANTSLNAFVTKLANDAAQQVRNKGDDYCVFAGELFDEASTASPLDINRIADKDWIASRHGYRRCVEQASRKQTG